MVAIIAVDVDDVCLDLVTNWIEKYNVDYGDTLTKDQVTDWDITSFVKNEYRDAMLSYIRDDEIFLSATPIKNALETILWLKNKFRVIYVTANDPLNCKFKWLLDNGFIEGVDDLIIAYDKSLILSSILIDDKYENVKDRDGGWLFSQPWNKKYNFKNRVENWIDIKNKIQKGTIKL